WRRDDAPGNRSVRSITPHERAPGRPRRSLPTMFGWDDWWIGPTDREYPVTRGLHVGFRARDRAQVDASGRPRSTRRYRAGAAHAVRPDLLRRLPARPDPTASRRSMTTARKPCPTAASTTCGSAS